MPRQISRVENSNSEMMVSSDGTNYGNTPQGYFKKFWCPSCYEEEANSDMSPTYGVPFLKGPSCVKIVDGGIICEKCGMKCVSTNAETDLVHQPDVKFRDAISKGDWGSFHAGKGGRYAKNHK